MRFENRKILRTRWIIKVIVKLLEKYVQRVYMYLWFLNSSRSEIQCCYDKTVGLKRYLVTLCYFCG